MRGKHHVTLHDYGLAFAYTVQYPTGRQLDKAVGSTGTPARSLALLVSFKTTSTTAGRNIKKGTIIMHAPKSDIGRVESAYTLGRGSMAA
eukprot:902501-Pelagomonas_calceolata.AAC.3